MSIGVEGGESGRQTTKPYPTKAGAEAKDIEEAHNEESRPSVGTQKKRSTIQKIKESFAKKRSERFYQFLNRDLPWGIKVVGGEFLCCVLLRC